MHKAQRNILVHLRHRPGTTGARFSELCATTDMTSDVFKFHIQKLVALDYISKHPSGRYRLTQRGKEFANRLDEKTGREIPQPKASMLLVARLHTGDEVRYLAHRRLREPFYGFWGIGSAPVLRGQSIVTAAREEFAKQTGVEATFSVHGVYHVIDRSTSGEVLEDKLFSIVVTDVEHEPPLREWYGGESVWLTRDELLARTPLFPTTAQTLAMLDTGATFAETECVYNEEEY